MKRDTETKGNIQYQTNVYTERQKKLRGRDRVRERERGTKREG